VNTGRKARCPVCQDGSKLWRTRDRELGELGDSYRIPGWTYIWRRRDRNSVTVP